MGAALAPNPLRCIWSDSTRATIEALDRLTNGREQTVKHVHVDNRGGQTFITDNVQTGGKEIGKIADQSHATGAAGTIAALPSPDPLRNGVPIPGSQWEAEMQNARRDKSRRA